ncbi:lactose-binding lectin l-2-like isoform X2 [Pangasianodon hypophthalmus]|uniref:lactose-binding lectin l-2-like isoform X2 n=1 Tax=Pangasianodon hypophthalmus TaxID=310915 RepID=UPI002307D8E2|nr:lactose-binding lectin l-2-like isoform X2 [Pangasianodon hypophthalmus]XP_034159662.2 lactose-binding lectin l-2-like isoform X2 [Pangasianodon hypophthalmus]
MQTHIHSHLLAYFGRWVETREPTQTRKFLSASLYKQHHLPECFTSSKKRLLIRYKWNFGEKHCLKLDAHLISIHSENEYQLVKALIRAHDAQEKPTWIGLTGCQKRNNFFWSDGTKVTFTKWNPTEPNFLPGEGCVHTNWSSSKNWNDIPCDQTYSFVCAKSIN